MILHDFFFYFTSPFALFLFGNRNMLIFGKINETFILWHYEVYIFYFKKLNNFLMILVYLFNNNNKKYCDILTFYEEKKTLRPLRFCSI